MLVWILVLILGSCLIALVIYYQEKNKARAYELEQLKKNMVSKAYNFEQLEFNLEQIRAGLNLLKEEKNLAQKEKMLDSISQKIDKIMDALSSAPRT